MNTASAAYQIHRAKQIIQRLTAHVEALAANDGTPEVIAEIRDSIRQWEARIAELSS
jgi:hypothetical protein